MKPNNEGHAGQGQAVCTPRVLRDSFDQRAADPQGSAGFRLEQNLGEELPQARFGVVTEVAVQSGDCGAERDLVQRSDGDEFVDHGERIAAT